VKFVRVFGIPDDKGLVGGMIRSWQGTCRRHCVMIIFSLPVNVYV